MQYDNFEFLSYDDFEFLKYDNIEFLSQKPNVSVVYEIYNSSSDIILIDFYFISHGLCNLKVKFYTTQGTKTPLALQSGLVVQFICFRISEHFEI